MLPKRHKLTRTTFPSYTDPKKIWNGSFLRIQCTYSKSSTPPLFAVVISKKIAASAVKRNELRRLIFQTIEDSSTAFSSLIGAKVVIFPLKKNGVVDILAIKKDIKDFFSQI